MSGQYNKYLSCIGTHFENEIAFYLHKVLKQNVRIMKKLELYSPYFKHNTEIDLVAITPSRIYCIEAKSCKSIDGRLSDTVWRVNANTNYRDFSYNFFFQNIQHIHALKYKYYNYTGKFLNIENIICVRDYTVNNTDSPCIYKFTDFLNKLMTDYKIDKKTVDFYNKEIYDMDNIVSVLRR